MPPESPLLSFLPPSARAAYSFIKSLAETKESASSILRKVREAGFELRRQTGLDVIGALRNNIDARRLIRLTPKGSILDPQYYGTALTRTLRNYSYNVLVRGVDVRTGETINRYVTVSSNEVLTQTQIESVAEERATDPKYPYRLAIEDITTVDALKSAILV